MKRRCFLRFAAATPALALLGGCTKKAPKKRETLAKAGLAPGKCHVEAKAAGSGRVLKAAEWQTLEAVCERIYPSSAGAPGARQANVINFIDAQLSQPPVNAFEPLLKIGAMQLGRLAKVKGGGKAYAELDAALQDRLLQRVERGRLGRYSGRRFMRIMVALTLEGLFADPIYGGNKDRAGWKGIGFTPQLPAPRCPWKSRPALRGRKRSRG